MELLTTYVKVMWSTERGVGFLDESKDNTEQTLIAKRYFVMNFSTKSDYIFYC